MKTAKNGASSAVVARLRRFVQESFNEDHVLKNCSNLFLSALPMATRLPFGAWWIKRNDNLAEPLLAGSFESAELAFVEKFLQPGMVVLDIGAHQGLYTLLASKRVGPSGRVFSFEPSPRERRALRVHLGLNFCRNVAVQGLALGSEETTADLFVVQGREKGCNSLRPPDVASATSTVTVRVSSLDEWLRRNGISHVDFIKLDVEGAELEVLKGAAEMLQKRPRPVILAEVQDLRTAPWGYRAKEILIRLGNAGYTWFRFLPNASLEELDLAPEEFDGNFVAWPGESAAVLKRSVLPRP